LKKGKQTRTHTREVENMMAYILFEVTPGTSRDVAAKAQKIEGVRSVSVVTGPHDVIAVVETSSAKALGDLLITKLQQIEGVASTITDVVID
jgi:DNA-binding Lrp family transcriptional regulator